MPVFLILDFYLEPSTCITQILIVIVHRKPGLRRDFFSKDINNHQNGLEKNKNTNLKTKFPHCKYNKCLTLNIILKTNQILKYLNYLMHGFLILIKFPLHSAEKDYYKK